MAIGGLVQPVVGGLVPPAIFPKIKAFFDASFADDPYDRRSTFGYVIMFGNTSIIWKSRKHKAITLSTTDSEYLAATKATRDVCWIQNILEDMNIKLELPILDNLNANGLANNTAVSNRTRSTYPYTYTYTYTYIPVHTGFAFYAHMQ